MKSERIGSIDCEPKFLEDLQEYEENTALGSRSETIRYLCKFGMKSDSALFLLLELLQGNSLADTLDDHPKAWAEFSQALALKLNAQESGFEAVEMAEIAGVELSPDTRRALERVDQSEATGEDIAKYIRFVPRLARAAAEDPEVQVPEP